MADRPKVLLVLGDAGFSATIASYIGIRGFEPVLAKSGASAFDVWKEIKPDVVIAAQLLPGMDGPTLCKVIKSAGSTPVILVCAVTSLSALGDVRRVSGADEVLPASFRPELLVSTLRKLTASRPKPGSTFSRGFQAAKANPPPAAASAASSARSGDAISSLTLDIEEAMRDAEVPDEPPSPVAPSPEGLAASQVPTTPMEPAWIVSRAFVDNVTGALRFVSGGVERIIYLAQGRPIVVTSNVPEERIGQILIRKGMLTPGELDKALTQTKTRQKRLVEIIVEMGVMTQRDHDEELASQYTDRLLALFGWHEASIEFQPRSAPAELVQIHLAPERIVMDGLRLHYAPPRLEAALQNPNRILYPAPGATERLPYLNLTPIESAALSYVDGQRSIAAVAAGAPSRPDALRALYGCVCLNILV